MGFRNYDPSLNQFVSRDMYDGALANLNLTTDPFTGSRYAFGAGNPVSNIELNGHMLCVAGGPCGSIQYLEHWSASQSASTSSGSGTKSSTPASGSGTGGFNPDVLNPSCPATACTGLSIGSSSVGTAAALSPVVKNFSELLALGHVQASAGYFGGAGYASDSLKSLSSSLGKAATKYGAELSGGGKVLQYGVGSGLALVGGAVSAYGEYNATNGNVAKTITVGVGDTAIGLGAGAVGTYVGGVIGGAVGSVIPVGGTIIGAAAGALIGGALGVAASNLFNDAVNSGVWHSITSFF